MRSLKIHFLILTSYFFLTILFTWPLVTQMTTHGFGHDEDSGYHLWHNWWFKYSIFDLHQSPLTTDYIFHPQKINLIYDANAFVFSAMTLPFQFLTGNVVLSSNLIFLFSFALSGLFAFLLTYYLLPSALLPAFIAGLIFAFNPYTTAQAIDGHINLTSTWMIPLYTWLLLKSLADGKFEFKMSIVAGVAAALQLYNDFTYTAFLIIETGLIFFFLFFQKVLRKDLASIYKYIKTAVVIALVAGLISLPLLIEVFKANQAGFRAGSPLWVQNVWSADLLTFFRPNDQTTFLKKPWTPNVGTVEGTAFVGYSILILLGGYALWFVLKSVRLDKRKMASDLAPTTTDVSNPPAGSIYVSREWWNMRFWVFLAVSFFILMLGPSLHYANNFVFNFLGKEFIFPLPYILLHKIPFVGETQEPTRLFPFFILPLSILVALCLKKAAENRSRIFSFVLFTFYLSLITFEYLTIPFPTLDLTTKSIFDTIRNDPQNKAVLTLPLGFNSGNYVLGASPIGSLQFYQTYFQKPSFRGTVARLPFENFEYYQKIPLVSYLLDPEQPIDFEGLKKDKEQIKEVFKNQLHIKYILVFENKYKKSLGETYRVIKEILDGKEIFNSGVIRAYTI